MRKTTVISAVIAAMGLTAAAALAASPHDKKWEELDVNGDGELSAAEMTAKRTEMVNQADTDGNGSLSRDEMKAWREAQREARDPDKNDDGLIDRTEFINAAQDRFDRLDKDGNGVLSEDERPRHGRRHGRGR